MASKRKSNRIESNRPATRAAPIERDVAPDDLGAPPSTFQQILTLFLLLSGVALWFAIGAGRGIGLPRWPVVAGAVAISLLPPVTRSVFALFEKLRHP